MRIFLDANVLFSAARSNGAMRKFLAELITSGHQLHADLYVVEEASRNLQAKEGADVQDALDTILRRVAVARVAVNKSLEQDLPLPENDRPVLAAAIEQRCDALVTGDRTYFGALYGKTLHGVTIYSPRSLAQAVLA